MKNKGVDTQKKMNTNERDPDKHAFDDGLDDDHYYGPRPTTTVNKKKKKKRKHQGEGEGEGEG